MSGKAQTKQVQINAYAQEGPTFHIKLKYELEIYISSIVVNNRAIAHSLLKYINLKDYFYLKILHL